MIFLLAINNWSDREKLIAIYEQYNKIILTIANDILKNYHESEDALQNVLVKLSKNLDCIDEVSSPKTKGFIIQVTRNHCYDVYNKNQRLLFCSEVTYFDVVDENNCESSSYSYESDISEQKFSKLIGNLKREYAEILTLMYYHELNIKEISKLLEISESNVSTRLNRAHNALKRHLNERND